jgi:DNA-binding winged helix-turn-helix (wHTH) protein
MQDHLAIEPDMKTPAAAEGSRPADPASRRRSVYRVGNVQYDEARQELLVNGMRRPIEAKPLALLLALLVRAGAVVTKRELIAAAWGNADHISEASLTTAMFKLRSALGPDARDLIDAVHGSGYRITSPVEVAAARETPLAFSLAPGDPVPGRSQWRLQTLLGSPALNDVWLARHHKTQELRVFKFADSQARLEALQREATLSRVLQATLGERDDLLRIAEWNFDERPYFIESAYGGPNLHDWAAARGGLLTVDLGDRLAMLGQLARTLAAAHAAGVLHSDIKPTNILVAEAQGARPRLTLIDFGAGGLNADLRLDAMTISMHGLKSEDSERGAGTLRYMAPEVVAGSVHTTGADIYALGILLYQLTTGDLTKSLTIGWEADIADDLLREDIATAASGDPARRLSSAADLANRLETLPARRAARAKAVQAAEHAAALSRQIERDRLRRPWILAASISLAAGLALSTLFGIQAMRDRDEARRRADIAQAVNGFLTEDLLGRGNPAQSGKADETLMDAAQAAEAGIGRRLASEPLVAGSIYLSLARAFDSRTSYDAALKAYDNAIAAFDRAGDKGRDEAAIARLHKAPAEVLSGQPGSMGRARAIIAEASPSVARLGKRRDEAQVWLDYGNAMLQMLGGDVHSAQVGFKRAADRAASMPGAFDEGSRLTLRQRLAFAYLRLGDVPTAETMIVPLLQRRLALNGPHHPATLQLELNLAQLRIMRGQLSLAAAELTRIYPDFVSVFGADHLLTMQLLSTRAQASSALQRYGDAVTDDTTVYRLAVAKHGEHSFMALGTLSDMAQAQCRGGQNAAGLESGRAARHGAREAFGVDSTLAQVSAVNTAFCLMVARQWQEADRLLQGIDTKAASELTMDPSFGAEVDLMKAELALTTGDPRKAAALLAKAAPVFEQEGADAYMQAWSRRLVAKCKLQNH